MKKTIGSLLSNESHPVSLAFNENSTPASTSGSSLFRRCTILTSLRNASRLLLFLVCLLGAIGEGQAVIITINGTYLPNANPYVPSEPFSMILDYDESYAPIYVPKGTPISDGGFRVGPLLSDNFYLFPVAGVTSFQAQYGNSPVVTFGTASGKPLLGGSENYLWFDADIRSAGVRVHDMALAFSAPDLYIGFGYFMWQSGGGLIPDGMWFLDDVTMRNSRGYFGFSPGNYRATVTSIPETGTTLTLLGSVFLVIVGFRSRAFANGRLFR